MTSTFMETPLPDLPLPLVDRLRACAQIWVDANTNEGSRASLSQLSRAVLNDGGYFSRLGTSASSTTTATLERFAGYLVDPANWADSQVPQEVCEFAHVVGVSSADCLPSSDSGAASIGEQPAEAAE